MVGSVEEMNVTITQIELLQDLIGEKDNEIASLHQRMERLAAYRDNWKAKAADEAQAHQRALDELSALQTQPHDLCCTVIADLRRQLAVSRREAELTDEDHAEGMNTLANTLRERDALKEALRGVLPLVLEGLGS